MTPSPTVVRTCCHSQDADADGVPSSSCGGLDCDDADPSVGPAAADVVEASVWSIERLERASASMLMHFAPRGSVAVDPDGPIHAAWSASDPDGYHVHYATDESGPSEISSPPDRAGG